MVGCVVEPEPEPPTPGPPEGPLPCDPPLSLGPADAVAVRLGLVALEPGGGSGSWTFTLVEDGSGAWLDERTGIYLAGGTAPATDVVALRDGLCIGEATLSIDVLAGMLVEPLAPTVPPNTPVQFAVSGGSGSHTCALVENDTQATVDLDCQYLAGHLEGIDVVRVEDQETGERVDRAVVVDEAYTFGLQPPSIAAPVGGSFVPDGLGADTVVEVEEGTSVRWDAGALRFDATGRTVLRAYDPFTGQEQRIVAEGLAPQQADLPATGDFTLHASLDGRHDLDGDGYNELIFGWPEDDLFAWNGGGARIFPGSATGPASGDLWRTGGAGQGDQMGRSLVVGDFDGDSFADLAVGAPFADTNGGDAGRVIVHRGVGGGLPNDEPAWSWLGTNSGDRLGDALAACDWNEDGFDDIAIAASRAENRSLDPDPDDQGLVRIHLGGPTGPTLAPWRELWGRLPTGDGDWADQSAVRFGTGLAALDHDGDGHCDLAVAAREWSTAPGRGNDGGIFVFVGSGSEIGPEPALFWSSADPMAASAEFGRTLAAGDLDDDGDDELIVGARDHDDPLRGGTNHGAVFVIDGGPWPGAEVLSAASPLDIPWVRTGDQSGDGLGASLLVDDIDADGRLELWVGAAAAEVPGGPDGAGTAWRFAPQDLSLPLTEPDLRLSGLASGDQFGLVLARSGTTTAPALASFAPRDDTSGFNVGRLDSIDVGTGVRTAHVLPHVPAGAAMGQSVAWVGDLDGDGWDELGVGAPKADSRVDRYDDGLVVLFRGTAWGAESEPWARIDPQLTIDGGDEFGYAITPLGDWTGDGLPDFAVIARQDDRPGSFPEPWAPGATCAGNSGGSGAIFVFAARPDGTAPTAPVAAWFGPQGGATVFAAAGGGDWNGDGIDDLAVGTPFTDDPGGDAGRVDVLFGHEPVGPGVEVLCSSDWTWTPEGGDRELGRSLAFVPDLDGDGCDELAVGAPKEDRGLANQGALHLIWGHGGPGCRVEAEVQTLIASDGEARLGAAIHAGPDVDGDGLADLVVGAYNLQVEGDRAGGAWLVRGAWWLGLPTQSLAEADAGTGWPLGDVLDDLGVLGSWHEGWTGRAVGLVGVGAEWGPGLWVSEALGGRGGADRAGGLCFWPAAVDLGAVVVAGQPSACIAGEVNRPYGRLGESIAVRADGKAVAAGGSLADALGTDSGGAWVYALVPPEP